MNKLYYMMITTVLLIPLVYIKSLKMLGEEETNSFVERVKIIEKFYGYSLTYIQMFYVYYVKCINFSPVFTASECD